MAETAIIVLTNQERQLHFITHKETTCANTVILNRKILSRILEPEESSWEENCCFFTKRNNNKWNKLLTNEAYFAEQA